MVEVVGYVLDEHWDQVPVSGWWLCVVLAVRVRFQIDICIHTDSHSHTHFFQVLTSTRLSGGSLVGDEIVLVSACVYVRMCSAIV